MKLFHSNTDMVIYSMVLVLVMLSLTGITGFWAARDRTKRFLHTMCRWLMVASLAGSVLVIEALVRAHYEHSPLFFVHLGCDVLFVAALVWHFSTMAPRIKGIRAHRKSGLVVIILYLPVMVTGMILLNKDFISKPKASHVRGFFDSRQSADLTG